MAAAPLLNAKAGMTFFSNLPFKFSKVEVFFPRDHFNFDVLIMFSNQKIVFFNLKGA